MKEETMKKTRSNPSQQKEPEYQSPDVEIMDIGISQNILAGSGDVPDMPGEIW